MRLTCFAVPVFGRARPLLLLLQVVIVVLVGCAGCGVRRATALRRTTETEAVKNVRCRNLDAAVEVFVRRGRGRGIWVDRTEVSNAQFLGFARATGYRTVAEEGVGSLCWQRPTGEWQVCPSVTWRTVNRERETEWGHLPVACIAGRDAKAYASWVGARLPAIDEMYFLQQMCALGQMERGGGLPTANVADLSFRGRWPFRQGRGSESYDDGYASVSPVGSLACDRCGLHDVIGNVREVCVIGRWRPDDARIPLGLHEHGPAVSAMMGGSWESEFGGPSDLDRWWARADDETPSEVDGFRCVADDYAAEVAASQPKGGAHGSLSIPKP